MITDVEKEYERAAIFWIYARSDDSFVILQSFAGQNMPASIGDYPLLGETRDIFVLLNYHLKQSEIAKACDIGQQAVSDYVAGGHNPRLNRDKWETLIRIYYENCRLLPEHQHNIELYRKNVKYRGRSKSPEGKRAYWRAAQQKHRAAQQQVD